MATRTPQIVAANLIGVVGLASFAGLGFGLSYLAVPCLLLPPPQSPLPAPAAASNAKSPTSTSTPKPASDEGLLARQWQMVFERGKAVGPVLAGTGAIAFSAAFRLLPRSATRQRQLYIAAAVLSVSVVPWTQFIMNRTNSELTRRANASAESRDEDVSPRDTAKAGTVESYSTKDLLQWWTQLNAGRSLLQVGGIACALGALVL